MAGLGWFSGSTSHEAWGSPSAATFPAGHGPPATFSPASVNRRRREEVALLPRLPHAPGNEPASLHRPVHRTDLHKQLRDVQFA